MTTSAFSVPSTSPSVCHIRGTLERHLTWGGLTSSGHQGLQVTSGNKVSVCRACSGPKTFDLFPPRNKNSNRVHSVKKTRSEFNTPGHGGVTCLCTSVGLFPSTVCLFFLYTLFSISRSSDCSSALRLLCTF